MPSVTIIGMGRVGGALEDSFRGSKYLVVAALRRGEFYAETSSDIVIIATPDGEIARVAAELTTHVRGGEVVLHTSGALSSDELSVLTEVGCAVGSMHPLVSISSRETGAKRFSDSYFCVEGDERAVIAAKEIVLFLGGQSFQIPAANKALYHAAAVAACGHVTALIDIAFSMMERSGVDAELSTKILEPLIRSTIDNISEQGTAAALTGTFARADAEGLKRQLRAFDGKLADEETEIYLDLARRSLQLAKTRGVGAEKIAATDELITLAKSKLR